VHRGNQQDRSPEWRLHDWKKQTKGQPAESAQEGDPQVRVGEALKAKPIRQTTTGENAQCAENGHDQTERKARAGLAPTMAPDEQARNPARRTVAVERDQRNPQVEINERRSVVAEVFPQLTCRRRN